MQSGGDDVNRRSTGQQSRSSVNLHSNKPAAQPQYSVYVGNTEDRRPADVINADVIGQYFVLDPEAVGREATIAN